MVSTEMGKEAPTQEQICQYVWARYIDNVKPKIEVDEEAALKFYEDYYAKHPLNEDDECFYYAVLLYERAFSDEANRARYLVKACEVFEVYRRVSGETEWDVIEDRLIDVKEIIETEGLLKTVKTAADLAPEIEGMVLIPAGASPFGVERHEVHLEPFYIDIYPVTNKAYRQFVEETNYRRPVLWERRPDLAGDDLPVTGVSWMDTLQYCKWSGKSLPTAEQWQKAARGPKGTTYPWGNDEPTPERANFWDGVMEPKLQPMEKFKAGVSPYGIHCMVGTVWEWTNTAFPDEEGTQIVMGGSYADPPLPEFLSSYAANWASKKEKNDLIGFRCTKRLDVH